jgi:hypothetical protein
MTQHIKQDHTKRARAPPPAAGVHCTRARGEGHAAAVASAVGFALSGDVVMSGSAP